jgi:NAD(P)-dependent dehydrogenase (short-subunit alcohol dehydrogenase family)
VPGRVAIVTGANSGIGYETTRALAGRGFTVIMACRRPDAGERAAQRIRALQPAADLHVFALDLARFADVRRFAREVQARFAKIHVLVNNAGIHTDRRVVTDDGHELTWQVNHLSHFLLTLLLLDRLKASAPSRIVNVASRAHRWSRMNWDDLEHERDWSGWRAYGQSKRANIVFTKELARRLEGTRVTANALHPGVVATNWARQGGGLLQVGTFLWRPFMVSAAKGADTVVWLASSPEAEGVTGRYFYRRKEKTPRPEAADPATGARLWAVSERAVAAHLAAAR